MIKTRTSNHREKAARRIYGSEAAHRIAVAGVAIYFYSCSGHLHRASTDLLGEPVLFDVGRAYLGTDASRTKRLGADRQPRHWLPASRRSQNSTGTSAPRSTFILAVIIRSGSVLADRRSRPQKRHLGWGVPSELQGARCASRHRPFG
jgi:hypothetical protein